MIQLSGAGKRFGHKLLFENLNWLITSKDRAGLVGAAVTPTAGRAIDRFGHRFALVAAFTSAAAGVCLTLVHSLPVVMVGLTLTCTGVFIANSAGSSYVG